MTYTQNLKKKKNLNYIYEYLHSTIFNHIHSKVYNLIPYSSCTLLVQKFYALDSLRKPDTRNLMQKSYLSYCVHLLKRHIFTILIVCRLVPILEAKDDVNLLKELKLFESLTFHFLLLL